MSETLKIKKQDDMLLVEYYSYNFPDMGDVIFRGLERNKKYKLKNTFSITLNSIIESDDEECICFKIGDLIDGYYLLDSEIFELEYKFYFHNTFKFEKKHFVAERNISILKKIDNIINEDFIVNSDLSSDECKNGMCCMNAAEYDNLIKNFPKSTELTKYSNFKINQIVSEYFEVKEDYTGVYEEYIRKKNEISKIPIDEDSLLFNKVLSNYEKEKYSLILRRLKYLLENESTLERHWQNEIIDIITLIFPKYMKVFSEYEILRYNDKAKRVDFILLDNNNNIDIIEIKKANGVNILNSTKSRGNYPPTKDLSSALMQVEKYLHYINTDSHNVSEKLKKAVKERENLDVEINVRSPKGIVILGRTKDFNQEQLQDYRLIKNAYKNILDIYSYDELILTLERIINKFSI
ncbi:Shedu immune nuclease family protein [Mammaliicoccus sp. Dog046]|uniref:Shedu immune nuclease family protein n=1 Tax=Mammaliicoccus sp. Dog046 TaxID=3034233 RepID=UPI002B25CCAF|nr:Shedu immune nuclease family protein [Mammaliicoccus sp. Dog046]WQK85547.1 Shedu immune nuclease family protein [Mammaliicoccus sp. Dog046]